MPADPRPTGTGEPQTLEERAREIIWRVAVWQDDEEDPLGNCAWAYALEYENEMGELVPRTIDAAREVHAVYADELARLRAEVEELTASLDAALTRERFEHARAEAAEARAARLEEALEKIAHEETRDAEWLRFVATGALNPEGGEDA